MSQITNLTLHLIHPQPFVWYEIKSQWTPIRVQISETMKISYGININEKREICQQ